MKFEKLDQRKINEVEAEMDSEEIRDRIFALFEV